MPRLSRIKWSSGRKDEFARWIQRELQNTISDRSSLEDDWTSRIEQWRAKLPTEEKDFPWPGASNIVYPLTAIHVDPVYSDFMAIFHASNDFYHAVPERPDRVATANTIREGLSRINRDFLKMRQVNKVGFLYNVILGTAIYKSHWVQHDAARRSYDFNTGQSRKRLDIKSQPRVDHIPLQHFYIPANSWEIDPDAPVGGARWVAQKFWLRKGKLQEMSKSTTSIEPPYDKKEVDFIMDWIVSGDEDKLDEKIKKEDNYEPFQNRKIELFEVWARYDVDNDGIEEDVVAIYHVRSNTILRTIHNPFQHGRRPFYRLQYLPSFGFYGMGMSEIDEWSQTAMNKMLNGLIDNVMVVNTRMYQAPLGSEIMPGEPIYPGKIWFTQPGETVGEIKLGDIYPSLPQTMSAILQWSEQRTGVSELRQGNITGLPSRTPASTVLSILREGNKRFDMIVSNMREPFNDMGRDLILNMAQFCPEDPVRWERYFKSTLGDVQAAEFLDVLEEIRSGGEDVVEQYGILVQAQSGASNKEIEKQSFVGMLQLVSQIYPQILQTAQLVGDPALVQETAMAAYKGGVELLTRLMEKFDIQNPEEYLPNIQAISALQEARQANGGQPPQQVPFAPQPQPGALGQFGL